MRRTLAIGDIHGGLKGLKQVLNRAQITQDDHLIFLGDYVDGWSESAQVIEYLIALKAKYICTFIRGNHDDLTYQWLSGNNHNESWMRHGGQGTIASYKGFSDQQIDIHKKFYESLTNYYIDEENRVYMHAGFQNQKGPEYEHHQTAFYWDRTLWEMACAIDAGIDNEHYLYPKRLNLFKEIYIGHTPVTRIARDTPTQMANVWNVDTGAAFYGTISILDVDTKAYWQSDPLYKLYPNETGRNG